MSYISEKEAILKTKIIPQTKKEDFEEFWLENVKKLRAKPLEFTKNKIKTPYDRTITTYEIIFNTIDDTKVYAYFSHPNNITKKLPCVAVFGGGGSYRDIYTQIVSTGVCCFAMDNRSQGGLTFDKADYSMGDGYHGNPGALLSYDLLNKDNFYLRNLYLDAVRAVDVIACLEEVDTTKIVTYGMSQGGALSIVSASLSGKVLRTFPTVPSYGCLVQRVEAGSGVFSAVKSYLTRYPSYTDKVFETLSYFDTNNMASLLKVKTDINLGMIDPICIPEFVYSIYSHVEGEKKIHFAPFTGHIISADFMEFMFNEFSKLVD
jgi:cephalosporin-C deacetylase